MGKVSAVLFDFGKVLSGPPNAQVWAQMQQVSGLSAETLDRVYWLPRDEYDRGGLNSNTYWNEVAREAGTAFDLATVAHLTALDVELWTEMNEPMIAWVHALHHAGIRTGILSNIGDAMAAGIRNKFDWISGFHHAVWSHELLLRKPDPAIYAVAAAGLATPPAEILFLDDKPENIDAAVAFGMQAILYTDHADFERDMQARGFASILRPTEKTLTLT